MVADLVCRGRVLRAEGGGMGWSCSQEKERWPEPPPVKCTEAVSRGEEDEDEKDNEEEE